MPSEATTKRPRAPATSTSSDRGTSVLPTSRVNRIIKADQDVNLCSKEAIFLIAKATERMVESLTSQAQATARLQKRNKLVKYSDLASTVNQPQWFYLGEVVPSPIPLKTAKALRQQNDEVANGSLMTVAATGAPEKAYEGKRVMKGKKRASLAAAAAAGPDERDLQVTDKRKTRGKQVKYDKDVGGDDDDEEDFSEGANTSEAGDMDVDD